MQHCRMNDIITKALKGQFLHKIWTKFQWHSNQEESVTRSMNFSIFTIHYSISCEISRGLFSKVYTPKMTFQSFRTCQAAYSHSHKLTMKALGVIQILAAIFEHTCAYARWALMHHFASVCPSVTGPKFTGPKFRLENISYLNEWI